MEPRSGGEVHCGITRGGEVVPTQDDIYPSACSSVLSIKFCAISTLYELSDIGRATVRIWAAACLATALTSWPFSAVSTTAARYGTGATPPSTTRPSAHLPAPSTVKATATDTTAKSYTWRSFSFVQAIFVPAAGVGTVTCVITSLGF